jgi:hypothetical protein
MIFLNASKPFNYRTISLVLVFINAFFKLNDSWTEPAKKRMLKLHFRHLGTSQNKKNIDINHSPVPTSKSLCHKGNGLFQDVTTKQKITFFITNFRWSGLIVCDKCLKILYLQVWRHPTSLIAEIGNWSIRTQITASMTLVNTSLRVNNMGSWRFLLVIDIMGAFHSAAATTDARIIINNGIPIFCHF